MNWLADFHFLRPWWFLALAPLALTLWQVYRRSDASNVWEKICDPHLLSNLMISSSFRTRSWFFALIIGWCLSVIAIAGPTWTKLELPVFKTGAATVLILDLSTSMRSTDLKPSRLTRTKFKLIDILKRKRAEQTALIVFANDAFVVSPLTDDSNTIAALVPSLETQIMPTQGSRPDRALALASELLAQTPTASAQILLLADSANQAAVEAAAKLRAQGVTVSVLGAGTLNGAPIPDPGGGFVKDINGRIVIPKLPVSSLRALAAAGGGLFAELSADDVDLEFLLDPSDKNETRATKLVADQWRDDGIWLVLALVPLASLAFRKGWLLVLVPFLVLPPTPAEAFSWKDLWWRQDQQAAALLEEGLAGEAATRFNNTRWRASAHFRARQFDDAVKGFAKDDSADGHYNRGNALAKLGKFHEALEAFDEAIEYSPEHEDALHNKELLEQILNELIENGDGAQRPQGDSASGQSSGESDQTDGSGADDSQNRDSEGDNPAAGGSDEGRREEEIDSQGESGRDRSQEDGTRYGDTTGSDNRREEESQQPSNSSNSGEAAADLEDELALSKLSDEDVQALEQWLRQIPDDPGGLLRRKLLLEHRRRQVLGEFEEVQEPW